MAQPRSSLPHRRFLHTYYGTRRSAIELPGSVNDSPCHEKVDYSYFSALCSGDGAGFLRERFRHNDAQRDYAASSASARSHRWNITHNLPLAEICTPLLSRLSCPPARFTGLRCTPFEIDRGYNAPPPTRGCAYEKRRFIGGSAYGSRTQFRYFVKLRDFDGNLRELEC